MERFLKEIINDKQQGKSQHSASGLHDGPMSYNDNQILGLDINKPPSVIFHVDDNGWKLSKNLNYGDLEWSKARN